MKFKYLILMLLFFPLNVFALESIDVDCKESNEINYECLVKGHFDYEISALDFHYEIPESSNLIKYELLNTWEGEADNFWVSLYSLDNYSNDFDIMKLYIESDNLENKDIILKDILVYDANYQEHEVKLNVKQEKKKENKVLIYVVCGIIIIGIIIVCTMIVLKKGVRV